MTVTVHMDLHVLRFYVISQGSALALFEEWHKTWYGERMDVKIGREEIEVCCPRIGE